MQGGYKGEITSRPYNREMVRIFLFFILCFFLFFILFVAFRLRSGRHFVVFSISFKVHSRTVLKPGGGKNPAGADLNCVAN